LLIDSFHALPYTHTHNPKLNTWNPITLSLALCLILGCGDDGTGPGNHAPEITSLTAEPDTLEPSGQCTVTCTAEDADDDSLAYTWGAQAGQISGSDAAVTWTAPNRGGTYSVWVTVDDGGGRTAADTVEVHVHGGTLLVGTEYGLWAVALDGTKRLFIFSTNTREVEVLGTRIFLGPGTTVTEVNHHGLAIATITKPPGFPFGTTFAVLPDAGFAFVDNNLDSIYFMDAGGGFDASGPVPYPSPDRLQSTKGVTVGD
jgi:hypothetical protein